MNSPRIAVEIIGGLGNQLFQYAAARAISVRLGIPLVLDLSGFDHYPLRRFQLRRFRMPIQTTSAFDLFLLRGQQKFYRSLIPSSWRFYGIRETAHYFQEIQIPKDVKKVHLVGYWQSEKYFSPIADLIREELRLPDLPMGLNADLLSRIKSTEAVSIHVRRGDYITNPVAASWLGVCGLDYYEGAISQIRKRTKNPEFYVFSDDIPWAKANLSIGHPTHYVDHNSEDPCEDLRLMSSCKHFIIANSSFSWWGAWLSGYSEKTVIAPKKWFLTSEKDDRDLIPETWIRM